MRWTTTIIGIAMFATACGSAPVSSASPSPASPSALVVFTTWVPDPKVTNGPEPGYKPSLTGLTGHDIQNAAAVIDSEGTSWVVYLSFTSLGTNLFAQLTRANVAACPGDSRGAGPGCPQRHLPMWLDLTQSDIDSWEDPTHAATVSQPYDLRCLTHGSSTAVCPKLVSDPITLQEIDGGHLTINGVFIQQTATDLATAINGGSRQKLR
jgi:preprotein translocase subunit SecD